MKLYQKETPTQVFSCEICGIFKNIFFLQNTLRGYFWKRKDILSSIHFLYHDLA